MTANPLQQRNRFTAKSSSLFSITLLETPRTFAEGLPSGGVGLEKKIKIV